MTDRTSAAGGTGPSRQPPTGAGARIRRTLCATVLLSEALVIVFALLVAKDLSDVPLRWLVSVGVAAALAAVLLAGGLRFRWAYPVGSVLQLLLVAAGVVVPVMFGLGALFAVLWFGSLLLARRVERLAGRTPEPG